MQSSTQQGTSERRFDDRLEELCWENGQLLVATPLQNCESVQLMTGSLNANRSSAVTAGQLTTNKDPTLEVVGNDDERLADFPIHVPGVKMMNCPDDSMGHQGSTLMQRNTLPSSLVSSHSYQHMNTIQGRDFSKQSASTGGDLQGVARLCRPSIRSELCNVDARVNIPVVSSIQPTMTRERFNKGSDAMLNSFSSHCMAFSPMQSLQNTHLNPNSGDAVVLNASQIDAITNLPSALRCVNSYTSVDISPASDLESVLLDSSEPTRISFSCGSGHSPNKSNKLGEVSGDRKTREIDDFDSESEGSYDDEVAPKKPRRGSVSTRRTRVAETHNQSERKRRGRINEKLKALQELIPNANKTDKASVLSEAIDYLKKLRLQLQVMCGRSGMSVSPILISQGVQHLQMPLGATGLNFATEAGMGMGGSVTSASFQSFPLPPAMVGSSAQVVTESMGVPGLQASGEEGFVSATSFFPSGIPLAYGPTDLNTSVSFHHPFQV